MKCMLSIFSTPVALAGPVVGVIFFFFVQISVALVTPFLEWHSAPHNYMGWWQTIALTWPCSCLR